jgi:predicted 2-oxoglutarate/Fe(II)-dependent dioxygenase YbiX
VIATHLGNGIVQFDDVMTIDDGFTTDFFDRLNKLNINQSSESEDGSIINEGNYRIEKDKIQLSPQRYTDLTKLNDPKDQEFIQTMQNSIHQCVRTYSHLFPVVAECIRWASHGYIIKYDVGQSIGPHSDCNIPYEKDGITPINTFPMQNVLTCGLMLNDGYQGGAISYRPWGIKTKPDSGSVLVYPSSYLGCHEVDPITSGTRYAYLMWYGQGPINGINHNVITDIVQVNSNQKVVPVGPLPPYV